MPLLARFSRIWTEAPLTKGINHLKQEHHSGQTHCSGATARKNLGLSELTMPRKRPTFVLRSEPDMIAEISSERALWMSLSSGSGERVHALPLQALHAHIHCNIQ